jgi:hypothetical protein
MTVMLRLYQFFLQLFPARYRRAFGREMSAVFQQRQADVSNSTMFVRYAFCIKEFTSLISTAIQERARHLDGREPQLAAGTCDDVPGFYTCEPYFPRRSALLHGGILSLAVFGAASAAFEYGVSHHVFRASLDSSQTANQTQYIETSESGFVAFGRSAAASTNGVLALVLGKQPATATIEVKPGRVKLDEFWSNILWVMRVHPRFGLAAIGGASAAQPQSKPDFSGRWELDLAKSEAPATPPAMVQNVEYDYPTLRWTTVFKDANAGRMTLPFLMVIADREGEVTASGNEEVVKTGSFERRSRTALEGQRLVTTWTMKTPQDSPEGRWVRSLSADGKTQTVEIEFHSALMGNLSAKLVFSKLSLKN